MAKSPRRVHDASFKTKVVLEALKGVKTLAQLSSEFGIHAQQITERTGTPVEATDARRHFLYLRVGIYQANAYRRATGANRIASFSADRPTEGGRRAVENDWLKKKYGRTDH